MDNFLFLFQIIKKSACKELIVNYLRFIKKTTFHFFVKNHYFQMKEFAEKITELIAASDLDMALATMYNLLSVAESELKNDVVILRGRFSKLKSEKRKGIITVSDESLEFSRISNSSLEILDEMVLNEVLFNPFINDVNDSIARDSKEESALEESVSRKTLMVSDAQKESLFRRMAYVKDMKHDIRGLWFDDTPDCELSELRLILALGVQLDRAATPIQAEKLIQKTPYDFMISDIWQQDNPKGGIEFFTHQVQKGMRIPTIFYITKFEEARGTPPLAFGITNRPNDLLHLVMDIIERK